MNKLSQNNISRIKHAKILRNFRKIHRTTGAILFIFFFILSISGLLLTWKKNSGGLILSESYSGSSIDFENWISLDSLHKNANRILYDSVSSSLKLDLKRIDIRKDKGMIKFIFSDNYWGIQLDGATGKLLHIEKRNSDFIENIHDGSILDYYFGTKKEQIKLIYSSILGLSLLSFTITGFWLWYGPKKMKKFRNNQSAY